MRSHVFLRFSPNHPEVLRNAMAPADLSDDFVAKVMAQDARQSTIKYSALGMQALLPKRLHLIV